MSTTKQDRHETPEAPRLEILPADERTGSCPSLLVDDLRWHDPQQPYAETLPLEGRHPEVVALLGVGLGYAAAGALQLSPGCQVVAWEPLPGMAEQARALLRDEWKISEQVAVESELADFQARLIERCRQADSMASIVNPALAARDRNLQKRFEEIIQEVVDAGTLSFAPRAVDAGKWIRLVDNLPAIASAPPLARFATVWAGHQAFVVASMPDAEALDTLRKRSSSCGLVTTPDLALVLAERGVTAELVVVGSSSPPPRECAQGFPKALLAITPDSHADWWALPAMGHASLGHTGCSFLLPPGDPSSVISFRWGSEIALVVAAYALGAQRVHTVGFPSSRDADWNWLCASRRRDRVLERIATSSSRELVLWNAASTSIMHETTTPAEAIDPSIAPSLGAGALQKALSRSRDAVRILRREARRYRGRVRRTKLEDYLLRRAEGDAFTRAFIAEHADPKRAIETRCDEALAFFDRATLRLPELDVALPSPPEAARELCDQTLRIFIDGDEEEPSTLPGQVLAHQLRRMTDRELEIIELPAALSELLGPTAQRLPQSLRILLIPLLCRFSGRALYLAPNVCVFDDPALLWETPLLGARALAPRQGAPSIVLLDAAAAGWDPRGLLEALADGLTVFDERLRPGAGTGIGTLPDRWCARDELRIDTAAMSYTCRPWLPWKSALHPLRWAWEFHLIAALEEGLILRSQLESTCELDHLREGLVDLKPEPSVTPSETTRI